jgi:ABC-type glycerol-3-phosphate transport system permease component
MFGSFFNRVTKIITKRLILFIMTFIILIPILLLIATSITPLGDIFSTKFSPIPKKATIEHYKVVFKETPFFINLINSLIIATATTVITVFIGMHAGYSIARYKYRGRNIFAIAILGVYIVPPILLASPLFMLMRKINLLNTRISLIVTHITLTLPFCVWVLRGYFETLPRDIEESAKIDGATRLKILWRIIFPLSKPAIATVGFYSLIVSWNEFLYALIMISEARLRTLPIGLGFMVGQEAGYLWGQLMAYASLTTIPMFLLFLAAQKYLISGLIAGSLKS